MKKSCFIINSRISDLSNWERKIKDYCLTRNIPFEIKFTNGPGDAILITEEAINNGSEIVIAMGGDGTFNEVLNGLLSSNKADTILFCGIPCGTANDFCKSIKMPKTIDDFFDSLSKGQIRKIDVGKVEFNMHSGESTERYFLNVSNVGFAAEVVEKVNNSKKFLGPTLTYLKAITGTILSSKTEEAIIKTDTEQWNGTLFNISICNGKFVGSGLQISPNASVSDSFFNITLLGKFTLLDYIKYLPKVFRGENIKHDALTYMVCKKISVEGLVKQLGVEMDGEFVGFTKASFVVVPEKLNIVFAGI